MIVIIVIFLFLGSFRSVLIPVVAIPISLIGAAFLMLVFGFTLNLLTLLAIVLSVGLVVDDAIVVVENVERHLHEGMTPYDAAIKGARELFGPIIAMTITLAAVYAPDRHFKAVSPGALFREFALTLAGAVLVSGVVALTLVADDVARNFCAQGDSHKGFAGWINHRFDVLRQQYLRTLLANTLQWRPVTLTLALIVILLMVPFLSVYASMSWRRRRTRALCLGIVQAAPNATIEQNTSLHRKGERCFESFPRPRTPSN